MQQLHVHHVLTLQPLSQKNLDLSLCFARTTCYPTVIFLGEFGPVKHFIFRTLEVKRASHNIRVSCENIQLDLEVDWGKLEVGFAARIFIFVTFV